MRNRAADAGHAERKPQQVKHMVASRFSVSEARRRLYALVVGAQRRRESCLITRYGEPAAALVPISVYEEWHRHQREAFFDLVRDLQKEAGPCPEEAGRVAGDAVSGVRAEG